MDKAEKPTTSNERRYAAYNEFKKTNPGVTYAEFHMKKVVSLLNDGAEHATLGANLKSGSDWWEPGGKKFDRFQRLFPVTETMRVVDYGCGSVRIGAHYMKFLQPGNYFGLDVSLDLIEMGKKQIGPEILNAKRPQFGGIDEASVQRAVDFGADLVFSHAVAFHIHPTDEPTYFRNLTRLVHKPGARLFFNAAMSDVPIGHIDMVKPKDGYLKALPELEFVRLVGPTKATKNGEHYELGLFEFRRK